MTDPDMPIRHEFLDLYDDGSEIDPFATSLRLPWDRPEPLLDPDPVGLWGRFLAWWHK